VSPGELERAFLSTPALSRRRFQAGIDLLRALAGQFRSAVKPNNGSDSPPAILAADPIANLRRFIEQHAGETIRLADLAAQVGLSPA
jgi:hypothetical protein